ncbi:MAG: TraR/DksA family transcriptional regulator [Gammaproteobacteria bacterium]|nr:MAG: TraR/DksA family transcriptional regulator [Gammaproteobacteria bacterium]
MDAGEKKQFRQVAQEVIELTRREIQRLKELTRPIAPDGAIGRISRIEAIGEKSINEAALRTATSRLAALENVITQIDDIDFGYCQVCGEAIPHGRLMLVPESRLCVKCAD